MKLLFIGDIVGRSGRAIVSQVLPELIENNEVDFVIANAENLAGGKGVTLKTLGEMRSAGVDFFTSGNHIYDIDGVEEIFADEKYPLIRPANYPDSNPGKGWQVVESKKGGNLLIVSLAGGLFMPQSLDSPFRALDKIFDEVDTEEYDYSIIDFHAEATSEKQALLWDFDGRVSAILGTHTHVQTNDAFVSDNGTAFQTDVGMCGSLESCIGMKSEGVIKKFRSQMPTSLSLKKDGKTQFNGTMVNLVEDGRAESVDIIRIVND